MAQSKNLKDLFKNLKDEDDYVETEYHTLFITEEESDPVMVEVPEKLAKKCGQPAVALTAKPNKRYSLYLSSFLSEDNDLPELLQKLKEAEDGDTIEVFIDSYGGSIFEGIKIFDVIKENFRGKIVTILEPHGASMGAYAFCQGNIRVAHDYSGLMFHTYSFGTYGKGHEIKAQSDFLEKFNERLDHQLLVESGFYSEEEYKALVHGDDYYLDTEEMCLRGIVTNVMVDGYYLSAEEYLDYLESDMKIQEFSEFLEDDEDVEEKE